jgi:hypothetical protein
MNRWADWCGGNASDLRLLMLGYVLTENFRVLFQSVQGNRVSLMSLKVTLKVKVKLCLCLTKHHAMKAYVGNGGIAPRILDLGTRWRWVISFTPQPLYPQERTPGIHWIGGWVSPRAGLDAGVRRKIPSPYRDSNPPPPIIQPVSQQYTTELSRICCCYTSLTILESRAQIRQTYTKVYPKVSGLAAWSDNCKWYSSLPLGVVVSLFCESI